MASLTFKDGHFTVNSVDLSAHVSSITLNLSKDTPEDTAMGDDSRSYLPDGLNTASIDVTYNADFAASQVDASNWAIYAGSSAVAFIVKPNGGTTGTSNPKYTGNCILTSFSPVQGSVGDTASATVSYQVTGDVARATSD